MEAGQEISYVSFLDVPEAVLRLVQQQLRQQNEEAEPVFSSTQEKHTCVRCGVEFASLEEQRTHFRSEWHRFNLQRISRGEDAVRYEEYLRSSSLSRGSDEHSDSERKDRTSICSNAGQNEAAEAAAAAAVADAVAIAESDDNSSEDEDSSSPDEEYDIEPQQRSKHVAVAQGTTAYQIPLYLAKLASTYPRTTPLKTCVLLLRSGRFSAAIFENNQVTHHKSFRRYTVRKKAGGSQSKHDSAGRRAKSVGSELRRQGEKKLMEEVRELLKTWATAIASCDLVFYSVPKRLYHVVFDYPGAVVDRRDPRTYTIPLIVHKPTGAEVQRVFTKVMTIAVVPISLEAIGETTSASTAAEQPKGPSTIHKSPRLSLTEAVDQARRRASSRILLNPLLLACEQDDTDAVTQILAKLEDPRELQLDDVLDWLFSSTPDGKTALHIAAEHNNVQIIKQLLYAGASPEIIDFRGRVPFYLCTTAQAKAAFQDYRAKHPRSWNWEKTAIPGPVDEETLRRKKEKEREKRKKKRAAKKRQQQEDKEQPQQPGTSDYDAEIDEEELSPRAARSRNNSRAGSLGAAQPWMEAFPEGAPLPELPAEPAGDDPTATHIAVKLEGGRTVCRRFRMTDNVSAIYALVCHQLEAAEMGNFDLIRRHPPSSLTPELDASIAHADLRNSVLLMRWK